MIEKLVIVVIIANSVLLFGYWFRFICRLILTTKTTRDYASEITTNIQLSFQEIEIKLQQTTPAEFDHLRLSLDCDYAFLVSLIRSSEMRLEDRLLQIDYWLMGALYRLDLLFWRGATRRALEEMASVVAHFANVLGKQATGCSV
jgi:hypothetical protein